MTDFEQRVINALKDAGLLNGFTIREEDDPMLALLTKIEPSCVKRTYTALYGPDGRTGHIRTTDFGHRQVPCISLWLDVEPAPPVSPTAKALRELKA